MKTKICALAFTALLIFGLLISLSACDGADAIGIVGAEINENGELVIEYSNGEYQNLGTVTGKDGVDADGTVNITTEGGSILPATAKGIRSAVSITCKFKATVQQGGWYPGGSHTTTKEYSSEGSGVIYKLDKSEGDAFIITNYHVVYDASSNTENGISDDISLYIYGSEIEEKAIAATYVGGSLYYDIAVLRVEDSEVLKASDASEISTADSDKVSVGEDAIVIGNAQGLGISVTSGIVSVDSEYITMAAADGKTEVSFRVMRVDAAVNSVNSCG